MPKPPSCERWLWCQLLSWMAIFFICMRILTKIVNIYNFCFFNQFHLLLMIQCMLDFIFTFCSFWFCWVFLYVNKFDGSAGGGTGTDFNTTANWDGSGALLSTDDLVITYTKNNITTISLSASVTVKSLTVNVTTATSNADKTCTIAIGNYTLTTTGNVSYTNAQTGISYIFTLNTQ